MNQISQFPVPFFLSVLVALALGLQAWAGRRKGWGLPSGMVLLTVLFWYHGDAAYNDYSSYQEKMGDAVLAAGWWQVFWFLIVFGVFVKPIHRLLNEKLLPLRSHTMLYYETDLLKVPQLQYKVDQAAWLLFIAWLLLMAIALWRVGFDWKGLFAPYLGAKKSPWGRGRVGGGFDAALSLAGYVQLLLTASFGVFAAVARKPSTRIMTLIVCVLALPFYFFDRTRNSMIAVALPGLLAWVFFRLRIGFPAKMGVLVGAFLFLNFWFSFVIANRGEGSIASQFGNSAAFERIEESRHEGVTMFSELGYMNYYFAEGTLEPNWGRRYFAELVNPIPRALWPGKPTVGLDYAVARGFASDNGSASSGGVTASIATGMIGQGIVNFGLFLGPVAAAFLMSLWVAILARQDLLGQDPARVLLYAVGMILTFNMGRDITLLVLYPFVFGWIGLWGAARLGLYQPVRPTLSQQEVEPDAPASG